MIHKMCEAAGMIPLKGLKLKDKMRFASEFTFERRSGKSEIDYIMVGEDRINEVRNMSIEDEVWDHCNTSHRSVTAEIAIACQKETRERKNKKTKKKKKEIKCNKIVNHKVWKDYKKESAKMGTDATAYKISQNKDTEQNWVDIKRMFQELGNLAKTITAKHDPIKKKR